MIKCNIIKNDRLYQIVDQFNERLEKIFSIASKWKFILWQEKENLKILFASNVKEKNI